jgi:large-conductance mechanosensitive channel
MDGVLISDTEKLDVDEELEGDDCQHRKNEETDTEVNKLEFKVYKRRWAMLALYLGYVVISAFQWIQYSIIADVIVHYYGVSYLAVNWTSMVFMLAFVITIIPATWLYNKIVSNFVHFFLNNFYSNNPV